MKKKNKKSADIYKARAQRISQAKKKKISKLAKEYKKMNRRRN